MRLLPLVSCLSVLALTACEGETDLATPSTNSAPSSQLTASCAELALVLTPLTINLELLNVNILGGASGGISMTTLSGLGGLNSYPITISAQRTATAISTPVAHPEQNAVIASAGNFQFEQGIELTPNGNSDPITLGDPAIENTDCLPSDDQQQPIEDLFIVSTGIPDHETGSFPNDRNPYAITEQSRLFHVTLTPELADANTELNTTRFDAILLNGIPVQLRDLGCYSSCGLPFPSNPMFEPALYGIDEYNGHVLPDGSYHYHADPKTLYSEPSESASPIIGYAADGFPIFGPWIDDDGVIRKAQSSYQLKIGGRPFPSSQFIYNGSSTDDYEYVAASGDLDECNGMVVNDVYGYYVTDTFPYILNCLRGTPDASFSIAEIE
ncbi:MAG: YHYH protein [Alcanivoracaceae bacterium]|nr:YHYH protein [Alcanivoracaceae bacterium]